MAFVCGVIAHKIGKEAHWKTVLGAVIGAVTYVILYLGKTFVEDAFIMGVPLNTVWLTVTQKGVVSTVNGIIAAVVSVPLYLTLKPLLQKAKLL
jgi:uncharacterized membrane protein